MELKQRKDSGNKVENKEYKDMTQEELGKEITAIINATNLIEVDKELLTKAIQEYSYR